MSSTNTDDRTTKARIRDAVIEVVAEGGLDAMTARNVAEAAGVSAGLVIHHFDSMDGLRAACDDYVARVIREYKRETISQGPRIDVLAAIRQSGLETLPGYLAAVLSDDSPAVATLVDRLVDDAEEYMQQGIESGMMQPTENVRGRAQVLTMWSLGALVMHRHVERLFGYDPTDSTMNSDPSAVAAYAAPGYEILGKGIFTEEFADNLRNSFKDIPAKENSRQLLR